MWSAMDVGDGIHLVFIVGTRKALRPLESKLGRTVTRHQVAVPTVYITATNHFGQKLELAEMFVGRLASMEEATQVTKKIAGRPGDGPAQWARQIRRLANRQPGAMLPATFQLPDELVKEIADLYLAECKRSTEPS